MKRQAWSLVYLQFKVDHLSAASALVIAAASMGLVEQMLLVCVDLMQR